MGRLKNKTGIITGGSSGVGAATARLFLAEDAEVVIVDKQTEIAQDLVNNPAMEFLSKDIGDERTWRELAGDFKKRKRRLDFLVNCAAVVRAAPIFDAQTEDWNELIRVNQNSVFYALREIGAVLCDQGKGSIINVASIAHRDNAAGSIAYSASKAAVVSMTRVAAKEFARFGVRVISVSPGMVETTMLDQLDPEGIHREAKLTSIPLRRAAKAEEVASMILYLASDDASYCTGSDYVIDGGATC